MKPKKRLYWVEHSYRDQYGVYYSDDSKLIKTAYTGTEEDCKAWRDKNNKSN